MKVKVRQEVIRELRVRKGWTQEKLAEFSSVHTRTIQRIENSGVASIESLNALAQALEVEPSILQRIETKMPAIDRRLTRDEYRRMPNQLTSMSYQEGQSLKQFRQQAERMENWRLNEWVAWAILFIGGFVTVKVLLLTQANLNRAVIFKVFFPGTAIGLLLILMGAVGIYLSKKAREEETRRSSEWVGWSFLFSGAFFTLNAFLLTQANLDKPVIFGVFALGLLLMLIAGFSILLSKKVGEQKVVGELPQPGRSNVPFKFKL